MVRGRSSVSGRSTSGYTDKPQNSSRWYYRSKPATNGYNGLHSDVTEHECEFHLQKYEELVQKYGRDSMASTTVCELLIDECSAYVDPDKPSRVPQDQREKTTQRECEFHLKKYEKLLLTYGRNSLASTSVRELLIDECGAYVDPDKPSSVPKGRRYQPTQFKCKLHLQKFEELVQKFGRDSLVATTNRELLIEKCGLGSDFDKPSCRAPK